MGLKIGNLCFSLTIITTESMHNSPHSCSANPQEYPTLQSNRIVFMEPIPSK